MDQEQRASERVEKRRTSSAQQPFRRVCPLLIASCALGLGAGFLLASLLSISQALPVPLGRWWPAMVQAHGHVQLFGWAGLFVWGVALHFLPRLRGKPMAFPGLLPWALALLAGGLALRVLSQPILSLAGGNAIAWQILLGLSALAELCGATALVGLLLMTLWGVPPNKARSALLAVLPALLCALLAFWLALALNLVGVFGALFAGQALLAAQMDVVVVDLALFGFLVPLALGMMVRVLPLYLGVRVFPPAVFQVVFGGYLLGLLLHLAAIGVGSALGNPLAASGALLLGSALLAFLAVQGVLLTGRLRRLMVAAVSNEQINLPARPYAVAQGNNPALFGPFAALIRSACAWLALAAALLLVNGLWQFVGGQGRVAEDAIRHSITAGFVMLLIFGVGQRMLPGFAGRRLRSPRLVAATLWLGNAAALLRVGPVLVGSLLGGLGLPVVVGQLLNSAFACSGPLALLALACFTWNIWGLLSARPPVRATAGSGS